MALAQRQALARGQTRPAAVSRRAVVVRAQYPDPSFIAATRREFPSKGVATPDEARVLLDDGYTYIDVRSPLECELVGKTRQAVNIPIVNAKFVYDAVANKKSLVQDRVAARDFVQTIAKKYNKQAKLLVGCSDGKAYSMDALMALDEAGYTNIVGLKGGYYAWFRTWDTKMTRRRSPVDKEFDPETIAVTKLGAPAPAAAASKPSGWGAAPAAPSSSSWGSSSSDSSWGSSSSASTPSYSAAPAGAVDATKAKSLIEQGYTYVDVRPALECEEVGKAKQATNVPFIDAKRVYDKVTEKKKIVKEARSGAEFAKLFAKRFPNKSAKIIIGCADGNTYTAEAVAALKSAGYTDIVPLSGGFYAWFKTWDNNMRPRRDNSYDPAKVANDMGFTTAATGASSYSNGSSSGWAAPKREPEPAYASASSSSSGEMSWADVIAGKR